MRQEGEFILFEDVFEFRDWLGSINPNRRIDKIQQHHTYRPGYAEFNGNNHFRLVRGMKNYHVDKNGWSDIAQHFTSFPDGTIVTGRDLAYKPAGIKGANARAICIEHIGWFDVGKDQMTERHKEIIIEMNVALCQRFDIAINEDTIIYHHWWDRKSGKRTNGEGHTKTCPGTNFFGGNKIEDAQANFYPLLINRMQPAVAETPVIATLPPNNTELEIPNVEEDIAVITASVPTEKEVPTTEEVVATLKDFKDISVEQFEIFLSNIAFWEDPVEDERNHLPSLLDKIIAIILLGIIATFFFSIIGLFLKKIRA